MYLCETKSELIQVLLRASISAGFPYGFSDNIEDRINLNEYMISNPTAKYFIRVQGHTMEKFGVFDVSMEFKTGTDSVLEIGTSSSQ